MEIQDYPDYMIYDDGRIYSKYKKAFLIPQIDRMGYHRVGLWNDGERKFFRVHRLVAIHYLPNPENKPCVDHIDRNKSNNHVSNLRWATPSENMQNRDVNKNNKSTGIKNIHYQKEGKGYHYKKIIRGNLHRKFFKTLEEAIDYKEEYELNQM